MVNRIIVTQRLKDLNRGCLPRDVVIRTIESFYGISSRYRKHILYPFSRKSRLVDSFIERLHCKLISLNRIKVIQVADLGLIYVEFFSRRGKCYSTYLWKN